MGFFSDAFDWISGSSLTANLAKTAALGYATKLLNDTTDDSDNDTSASSLGVVEDNGVRLQLDPNPQNKLPILYGEAYFGGYLTDAEISADYKKMTYCLSLSELTGNKLDDTPSEYTFKNVYLNNSRVVFKPDGITVDHTVNTEGIEDISLRDLIKIYFYADVPLQPDGFAGSTPGSSTIMPGWSAGTHPMTGVMYALIEVTYNRDKNAVGLPSCTWHVENSMTYPGDVLNDYMQNEVYGGGVSETEIDDSLSDLNDYSIAGFSYTDADLGAQTGPIAINGLIDTNKNVLSNMQALVKCVSSWVSYDINAGMWSVVINKQGSSVANFNDSNIVDDINVSGTSLTQLYNASDVKYQNTDILDKTDFVKIVMPPGDLYQNEPGSFQQVTLPYTNKQAVAIKVGLLGLKQSRIDKVITFTADYSYINLKAGQLIDITSSIYGYTNKLFRIITTSEVDGAEGAISVEFTCLEYDASIYTYDISEYKIETDDGILNIGSIGKPDVPLITNNFKDVDPHVLITGKVPSGIVDIMEFWITHDVEIQNDEDRVYTSVGQMIETINPTYEENEEVIFKYTTTDTGDFFAKVGGRNTVVTGPLSDPSGLVQYVPLQVADTVSDVPVELDDGLWSNLGLLTLLKGLDHLMRDDNDPTGDGGIWDRIFDLFEDETGVDLPTEAENGNLGPHNLDSHTDVDTVGKVSGEVLTWNGSFWIADATCCGGGGPVDPPEEECFALVSTIPADNEPQADCIGPYTMIFSNLSGRVLLHGSGIVQLYKSDGTLVETVPAASLIIEGSSVDIPFADRDQCTDYYILLDHCIITNSLNCCSEEIILPTIWNFTTCLAMEDLPEPPPGDPLNPLELIQYCDLGLDNDGDRNTTLCTTGVGGVCLIIETDCVGAAEAIYEPVLHYNKPVASTTGAEALLLDYTTGDVLQNLGTSQVDQNCATRAYITMPICVPGVTYNIELPTGFVTAVEDGEESDYVLKIYNQPEAFGPSAKKEDDYLSNTPKISSDEGVFEMDMEEQVSLDQGDMRIFQVGVDGPDILKETINATDPSVTVTDNDDFYVYETDPYRTEDEVNLFHNIRLYYTVSIERNVGSFHIYKSPDVDSDGPGTLVQSFDVNTSFESNYTSGIISVSGHTVTLNPTVCFDPDSRYYILGDVAAVKSLCGALWVGEDDPTKHYFFTSLYVTSGEEGDMTGEIVGPPQSETSDIPGPVNNTGITMEFELDVAEGPGQTYIYKSDGTLVETYQSNSPEVTITNE